MRNAVTTVEVVLAVVAGLAAEALRARRAARRSDVWSAVTDRL